MVVVNSLPKPDSDMDAWLKVGHRLWVARHDQSEDVQKLSLELWEAAEMQVCILFEVQFNSLLLRSN